MAYVQTVQIVSINSYQALVRCFIQLWCIRILLCIDGTDPTPTIGGVTGGTFSISKYHSRKSSTGVVDLSASTAGTYTVTYLTAGTCSNSSTESITVNAIPSTPATVTPITVCPGADVILSATGSGTGNIIFYDGSLTQIASTPMPPATATFNVGALADGTYMFSATEENGGCESTPVAINVTVGDITAPTAVCQDITIFLNGSGSASIAASDIDGGSTDDCGAVTFSASQTTFDCSNIFGAPANNLVITAAFDADLSGGTPKGIELFVLADIADLSNYGIGSANNGGGSDGEEFTFPAVAVTAGTFIYVASESTQFTNFFGFAPDYTNGSMGINGDDAVELFFGGNVIDVFGDINVDGSGQPWEYADGWASRNTGTGPDGSVFSLASWSFSGAGGLDNETTNATASTPIPIATYAYVAGPGPTPVTLTVTDGSGNMSTCTANVTVSDTVLPIISCNSGTQNISDDGSGDCTFTPFASGQAGSYSISDNCSSVLSVQEVFTGALTASSTFPLAPGTNYTPVQVFPVGVTNVTVTVTDESGNSASCSYTTTITDDEAPTAVCQNINVYLDVAGNATIVAADIDGGSTDDCSAVTFSASTTAFTCADLGANNVILTVTDGNTNTDVCTAVVTVLDTISPVITCPGDQTEIASAICNVIVPDYSALVSASDNCAGLIAITQSPAAGTAISSNTTITFTADDGNGNTSTCTFDVIIDFSACQGAECSNAIVVNPLDPCGDTEVLTGSTVGSTPNTESFFCGTTLGTGGAKWYTFTGDGGDWTASSVNPGTNFDTKIWVYDGVCGALNCVTGNDDFVGTQSQVTFPTVAGTEYFVVIGGFSSDEGNFELTFSNVETEAPVADAMSLSDVNAVCEVTILTDPSATDNCSAVTVTNNATLPITANTTITWTYTDASGNFSTQTQNVVLTDLVAPTASNPADSTYECVGDAIIDVGVVTDEADNCTGAITVTHVSDVVTGNGCQDTITRTYNVADVSGNNIDVVQMIYIEDITAPTATNPTSLTVQCIGEVPAPVTGWVTDEADNCAVPTVAFVSDVSDGLSCPETITRIYSVTDDCGNTINITHLILITDAFLPTASNPVLINVGCIADIPAADVNVVTDEFDNQGIPTVAFVVRCIRWIELVQRQLQEHIQLQMFVEVKSQFVANNFLPGSGVTYQWVDCDLDQPIANETNHNYTPTYGSNFAVIITEAGCSDTSVCMPSTVGIEGLDIKMLVLYPNPTKGLVNLEYYLPEQMDQVTATVYDLQGRKVYAQQLTTSVGSNESTLQLSKLRTGSYIVLMSGYKKGGVKYLSHKILILE